jgi:type II secretory pathway component PulJ
VTRRPAEAASTRRAAEAAFTLLEMLFVVLVSSIVLTFAANFYVDLSYASSAALASNVELRRATGVLDRVARDLECATLVKTPEGLDPLEHPWLFLAEGRGSDGADRLRFQTRNHRPRSGAGHESDLVEVAYWLVRSEVSGSFDLLRWASARPPAPPLDRNFPRRDDPGVELLASGIALFAVRLQDADGAWQSAWDSWSPAHSSALPIAAEVRIAFLPEAESDEEAAARAEPEVFERPLVFALDALDLEKALGGDAEEEEKEEELACVTVSECVARNQAAVDAFLAENPGAGDIFTSIADQCWKDHATSVPVEVTNCDE